MMRRIILIGVLSLLTSPIFGQTVVLECGQNSGINFNGWYINQHQVFESIEFDEQSVSFISEVGGNFSVSLIKKVEEMSNYTELNILFTFEAVQNCEIDNVVYYTSADGVNWNPVQNSRNNVAVSVLNKEHTITYIKATVNAQFYTNGKLVCNYVKVEGQLQEETVLATISDDITDDVAESFFIFNYNHRLNIETQQNDLYTIVITAITGQVVFKENFEGSNRIDIPADIQGVYVVSIIQDGEIKAGKKVLF